MATNIEELCSSFSNGIRLERAKLGNKMENSLADVERNIIEKELNNHSINASDARLKCTKKEFFIALAERLTDKVSSTQINLTKLKNLKKNYWRSKSKISQKNLKTMRKPSVNLNAKSWK
jgi:hypothetical protein